MSGTAPEGVLSMEEMARLNEMREVATQGQNLSPEDKESLTRVTDELSHVGKVAVRPDEQTLYVPDSKSKGEEGSEHLQLQLHQYSDSLKGISDRRSTSGAALEGGVLSMEELVVTEGQDLFPQDEESLTKLTEDLSGTSMYTFPQHIFRLVTLQKLLLRNCEILMMELPPEIGELKNLEVLDLEGTEILCLPMEIAKLVNLTCLKVSFYGYANQTVIPKTVLSNLSRLKELIIDVTPYGEWWDVEVKAIIDDLRSLKELTTLKLYLPTAELLEDLTLIFPDLANFRFTVGRQGEHFISRLPQDVEEEFNNQEKLEKGLKFINGNCIPNEITKVLKHANAFFLQCHWITESLSEFGHENLNEVKFLLVMDCNEFRTIIDFEKLYQRKDGSAESEVFQDFNEATVLGSLERLIIRYMKNMESIWKGSVANGSLSNLKSLALHTCPKLTTLFTINMLSNLINLEELIVEDCPKINSLVSLQNSSSKSMHFLPSLKKISLLYLPRLVSISSGLGIAPKLERMVVFYCPKLEKLSATEVSSTGLKVIKAEKEWWDALKWYESDLSTEDEDHLDCLFIPLRRDGDLMAQLTEDEFGGYGQGEVGSSKIPDPPSEEISSEESEETPSNLREILDPPLEEISSEESEETPSNPREILDPPSKEISLEESEETHPRERLDKKMSQVDQLSDENGNKRTKYEEGEIKKIKGTVLLLKKNLLDFNFFTASLADSFDEVLGHKVSLQLISAVNGDPGKEFRGKLGKPAYLEDWITKITPLTAADVTFNVKFEWEEEVGVPGALLVKNSHHNEFYLKTVTLEDVPGHGRIHFVCNSWVYPAEYYKNDRVFFTNQTYLPTETPQPLRYYREEELLTLRGNGTEKLEEWDRVYDYDVYNDLSEPEKGPEHARPILGGSTEYPYPRRGRTGRPPAETDPRYESRLPLLKSLSIYVPRDERFSYLKLSDVVAYGLKSVFQFLRPEFEAQFDSTPSEFDSLEDILKLYEGGVKLPDFPFLESIRREIPFPMLKEIFRTDGERPFHFPMPQVIKEDKTAWRTDEEFAREMLAGLNPVVIRLLQEFPPNSKLNPKASNDEASSKTKERMEENLEGLTIEEALQCNKLFTLDYHDALMPYLSRINLTSAKIYATRTLLFLKSDGTLKPLAIELSVPHPDGDQLGEVTEVYTPAEHGAEGTIWQLAKAYVAINDSGYHQLICHWLHTHAAIEPFVIATNRQLSVLHPIHKLLHPHFRDTMNLNALARQTLINAGGLLERTVFPAKYAMEWSAVAYKDWVFPEQALPADLIKRGVAVEDPKYPHGVRLLIEDYPYAVDGLEIWSAIKTWVEDYCFLYYKTDDMVQEDSELQLWWNEIREKGHGDKKNASWWHKMQNRKELVETCTIIIWIASALHAAVNFGQYAYGGYIPNRPAMSRRFIPKQGSLEYDELESNPDKAFLKTVTPQLQSILGISLIEILSRHTSDEVFLGQRDTPEWTADKKTLEAFGRFGQKLAEIEDRIISMNRDENWKNRVGPAKVPYTLLFPSSEVGLTGRGIPNSVSI